MRGRRGASGRRLSHHGSSLDKWTDEPRIEQERSARRQHQHGPRTRAHYNHSRVRAPTLQLRGSTAGAAADAHPEIKEHRYHTYQRPGRGREREREREAERTVHGDGCQRQSACLSRRVALLGRKGPRRTVYMLTVVQRERMRYGDCTFDRNTRLVWWRQEQKFRTEPSETQPSAPFRFARECCVAKRSILLLVLSSSGEYGGRGCRGRRAR